jgi:uncharacterized protein YjbI with pentapeptide repeats
MNESDNSPATNTSELQIVGKDLPDLKIYGYQVYEKLSEQIDHGRISYLGLDINSDRLVVIKAWQSRADQTPVLDYGNYLPEIKRLQQIDSPNIPRYLNSFATLTGFCVVREYQSGVSLAELGDLPPSDIQLVADGVLKILADLNRLKPTVIHQNIKPENIIVTSEPNLLISLVDFGLHPSGVVQEIATTPGFASPAQLASSNITATTDIYSLGVSLACLITGTPTAQAPSLFDSSARLQFQHLLPPNTDPELIKSLEIMVEPNRHQRSINQNSVVPVRNNRRSKASKSMDELRANLDSITEPKQKISWLKWGIGLSVLLGSALIARQLFFADDAELSPAQIAKNQSIAQKADFAASDRGRLLKEKQCDKCNFNDQNFVKADLQGAIVPQSTFTGADFSGANLRLASFRDADLSGANFSKANLSQAAFYGAKLIGTNLVGADLSKAKMVYAKLKGSLLRDTNLSNADLKFADFQQVDLTRANLTGADLTSADFSYTNLRKAILAGAKMEGTILTGATMPDGSTHP